MLNIASSDIEFKQQSHRAVLNQIKNRKLSVEKIRPPQVKVQAVRNIVVEDENR